MTYTQRELPPMRRGVRSFMHRTPAEQAATPCRRRNRAALLCVLQVLLLLLLAALPLPRCNAAATKSKSRNVATRAGAAKANAADEDVVVLKRCYPDIVLYFSNITYYCEVEDTKKLEKEDLRVSYYKDGILNNGWPAKLQKNSNVVSFVPFGGATTGLFDVVVTRVSWWAPVLCIPMTTNVTLDFRTFWETTVHFSTVSPYYGMPVIVVTNVPNRYKWDRHLLVDSREECRPTMADCSAENNCYMAASYLPVPTLGTYRLCLTMESWNKHYLPWGTVNFDVGAMVLTPLYILNGTRVQFTTHDAGKGRPIRWLMRNYMLRCPDNICSYIPMRGLVDKAIHLDQCLDTWPPKRVNLDIDGVVIAKEGTYAFCATRGSASGVSPGALPIRVIEKPFAFKVVFGIDYAIVYVSGGDFAWREEPYVVCAVLPDVPCDSVSSGGLLCVTSASPTEPSVFLDLLSRRLSMDTVKLCFVAANITFVGRTYTWTIEAKETKEAVPELTVIEQLGPVVIFQITLSVLIVVVILASLVVCFLRWRRRKKGADVSAIDSSCSLSTSEVLSTVSSGDSTSAAPQPSRSAMRPQETQFRFITFLAMAGEFVVVRRLVRYMEAEVPRTGGDPALAAITPDGTRTSAPLGGDYLFKTLPGVDPSRSKVFVDASGHTCLTFGADLESGEGLEPVARRRWLFVTLWTKYGPDVPTCDTVDLMREVVLPPDFVPGRRSIAFLNRLMLEKDVPAHHLMESSLFPIATCTVILGAEQQEAFSTRSAPNDSWSIENLEERYFANPLNPMGYVPSMKSFSHPIPTRRKGGHRKGGR